MAYMTPTPVLDPSDDKTMRVGPAASFYHGVLRLLVEIDGETVRPVVPDIGYLHTGIEKTCEAKFYQQVVPMTDRIDYLRPMTNNLAYCLAVEKLLGLEIPPKGAVDSRHVERVDAHQLASGLAGHARHGHRRHDRLPVLLPRTRKIVATVRERYSGQRMMTFVFFRIGGLALEPPLVFRARQELRRSLSREHRRVRKPVDPAIPIWTGRTQGIAHLSADAIALCATGPTLRAGASNVDLRRGAAPYGGYEKFQFNVPCATHGDVFARIVVRVQELRESQKMVKQPLEGIPEGPWRARNAFRRVAADREKMEALIYHLRL